VTTDEYDGTGEAAEGRDQGVEGISPQRDITPSAVPLRLTATYDARFFQHLEMVRQQIPRHFQRTPELPDCQIASDQEIHRTEPTLVTQRRMND
jgi:hypothetical protein